MRLEHYFCFFSAVMCCRTHEVDCDGHCLFELHRSLVPLFEGLPQGSVPPWGHGGVSASVAFAR